MQRELCLDAGNLFCARYDNMEDTYCCDYGREVCEQAFAASEWICVGSESAGGLVVEDD